MIENLEIWIGLIGVKPKSELCDCLKHGEAGYLTAVTVASDSQDFRSRTTSALAFWNLEPFEFENVETLAERSKQVAIPLPMVSLAEQSETDGRVRCSEIFIYEEE
jgi:hypothetical protein